MTKPLERTAFASAIAAVHLNRTLVPCVIAAVIHAEAKKDDIGFRNGVTTSSSTPDVSNDHAEMESAIVNCGWRVSSYRGCTHARALEDSTFAHCRRVFGDIN